MILYLSYVHCFALSIRYLKGSISLIEDVEYIIYIFFKQMLTSLEQISGLFAYENVEYDRRIQ